jgi:CheY-like chemotaxis protein
MKKRILVVDDDPAITRLVKLNLERSGDYEVRTENLGRRAIEVSRLFRPDFIILDVFMPGMLGSEVAAQLQADPELRAIKFVFLTGAVTKGEEIKSAGRIGGHTFVAKPFTALDLHRVVEDHLRPPEGERLARSCESASVSNALCASNMMAGLDARNRRMAEGRSA